MKRFHFPLETLLTLRLRREEQILIRLGEKRREIARSREEMAQLGEELGTLQEEERVRRTLEPSLQAMRASVLFRHSLKRKMMQTGRRLDALYDEADGIHRDLAQAATRRKALELLRERRLDSWKKEWLAYQQNELDDSSARSHIRRAQSRAVANGHF